MQSPRQVERVGWSTHFSLHTPVLLWIWCSCQTLSLWHTVAPDNQITMKNNKKGIELGHSWPTVIHPGDLSKVSDDSAAAGRCPWITQQLHQIKVSSAFLPLWYFPCKSRVCCIVLLCHLPYFSLKEEETIDVKVQKIFSSLGKCKRVSFALITGYQSLGYWRKFKKPWLALVLIRDVFFFQQYKESLPHWICNQGGIFCIFA